MIAFAQETYDTLRADIEPLLELHYREVALNQDVVKLDPMFERYQQLDQDGRILFFTARDEGALIGYAIFFTDVHLHYVNSLMAISDVIFVLREYRRKTNQGWIFWSRLKRSKPLKVGSGLIDFSEQTMRMIGVDKVIYHIKFKFDWSPMLLRRGYGKEDFTVAKILKRG